MANKIKLLGIAPYEELNHSMTVVGEQFGEIDIHIYTADLEEGQQLVSELSVENYDAIISRGGTASLIHQSVSIPVIDVSISVYDILGAIKLANNYTSNFAIIGYPSITETAHLICDILQYNIKIITLDNPLSADSLLDQLKAEQYEMVLCDAVTHKMALNKSINTILITSGIESIKHAYRQAISLVNDLKQIRQKNELLTACFNTQSQKVTILDQKLQTVFTNIDPKLEKSVRHFLTTKNNLEGEQQFYHTHNTQVYQLKIKRLDLEDGYYLCEVKNSTPPLINNSFGVSYMNKAEVEEIINKKLLFTSYIHESSKHQLDKLGSHYNAMLIFGESGTAKTSLAYTAYLKQKNHTSNLIVIQSELVNERTWKYLLNSSNGPLVETGNTLLFKNVEQMSIQDVERLLTIISNTRLLQKNNILFTYSTKSADKDKQIFNRIMAEVDCGSIYSPSIEERKNELSGIITLLLNKINIECNKEVIGFDPKALRELLSFSWPGNLNQLEQTVKKLVLYSNSYYISEYQVLELLKHERTESPAVNIDSNLAQHLVEDKTLFDYSREIVIAVLEQNKGNQTKTAKQLGISRTTMWRYLKID
ncbi:sigma-54-dependent Fis family transcriptional regulator [Paenibacillus typhae]|uniref:sigma-54-dependent Fis family transcriptional regulator n=1 Tax=Paenibacillus typhae TaxID=1174501 RepID=UPI001C8E69AE|nr:sigma-54-dependent transcriptional regulator [Paenibacillus typhae]MBY0013044.1 PrpR N-terminal domain-containing protein [Paenibacillus typhae]